MRCTTLLPEPGAPGVTDGARRALRDGGGAVGSSLRTTPLSCEGV